MERSPARGAGFCAAATLTLGFSVGATSLLTAYPFAAGQAFRYGLASLVLACLAAGRGRLRRLGDLSARDWFTLTALAATGLVGFNLFLLGSVSRTDPALSGTIIGCTPIVLAVTGPVLERRWPGVAGIAAAVVVAGGAALVQGTSARAAPEGVLLALGAVLGEALFSLLAVPLLPRLGPLTLSFAVCSIATVMFSVLAPVIDAGTLLRAPTPRQAGALLFLSVAVTVGGFLAWYSGLSRLGPTRAGLFAGLIPVTAEAGSVLAGTSVLTAWKVAGAVVVGLGVVAGLARARQRTSELHQAV